jgi:hypothetical protein
LSKKANPPCRHRTAGHQLARQLILASAQADDRIPHLRPLDDRPQVFLAEGDRTIQQPLSQGSGEAFDHRRAEVGDRSGGRFRRLDPSLCFVPLFAQGAEAVFQGGVGEIKDAIFDCGVKALEPGLGLAQGNAEGVQTGASGPLRARPGLL